MAHIGYCEDKNGGTLIPYTLEKCVSDADGVPLTNKIKNINDSINDVNNKLTVKKATLLDYCNVRQFGNVVTINGYFMNLNITTNLTEVATLPSNISKPNETIRANIGVGANAYTSGAEGLMLIDTDGKIQLRATSGTATAAYFSVSYIVD